MYLYSLVFICGAAVMIIEIVSARFFAPFFGTSVAVWTGVIGVIMAGLSVGYAVGGALGDRWKSVARLRVIVACAGMWTLLLILVREPVMRGLFIAGNSQAVSAVIGSIVLLLVPSILLGMVSPYSVRLATRDTAHAGRTAGKLSALSTCGSILGTFLAGFFLVPSAGLSIILAGTAFVLLALAAANRSVRGVLLILAALMLVLHVLRWHERWVERVHAFNGILLEADTPYSSVTVWDREDSFWGKNVRFLFIDNGYHGAMSLEDPSTLVFHYTRAYRLAEALRPDARRALLLGGGAFTVARDYRARHPEGSIDVVEIDPVVINAAKTYFKLEDDPGINVILEDARTFTRREAAARPGAYQVVFGDVFRSSHTVPFHLTTRETAEEIFSLLDERGVYLVNVIASEDGEKSAFLQAMIRTLSDVFPSVLAIHSSPTGKNGLGNFLVIASKEPPDIETVRARAAPPLHVMLDNVVTARDPAAMLLTDDYAPVEVMLQW